ncbi:MAG TPA: TrkA C-terminal domain-containing protein [Chloroflexota bacterium]|nr:TrkA C-terminal domain-containing protein [Chloroflexota bacterium]
MRERRTTDLASRLAGSRASLPGTDYMPLATDWAESREAFKLVVLEEALRTMALRNVGRLPVVLPGNPHRMIGLLRRNDLIEAFRRQTAPSRPAVPSLDIGAWGGTRFIEMVLAPAAPAANHLVRELASSLPRDTVIVAIRRASSGRVLLPWGGTDLRPGDVVVLLTRPQHDGATRKLCESPAPASEIQTL